MQADHQCHPWSFYNDKLRNASVINQCTSDSSVDRYYSIECLEKVALVIVIVVVLTVIKVCIEHERDNIESKVVYNNFYHMLGR